MGTILKVLGTNIRKIRKGKKITIKSLSGITGLNAKYLQRVETAKNNISILNIEKIAKALEVDVNSLLERDVSLDENSNEKISTISSKLKDYNVKQLDFVYAVLDTIKTIQQPQEGSAEELIVDKKMNKDDVDTEGKIKDEQSDEKNTESKDITWQHY